MRLFQAIHEVRELIKVSAGFAWKDRRKWGIEEEAWEYVAMKGMSPLLIFAHPRVLNEQPRLLLYYRTVSLLSQKGLGYLVGGNIAKIESGEQETLDSEWVKKVTVALNSVASAVIRGSAEIDEVDLPGFQFATAGATIQGSWNNAIGDEGEANVRTILLNHLKEEIAQVVWRDGTSTNYTQNIHTDILDRVSDLRVIRLKQGFHINFSSEPDASLRDQNDIPHVAVEVKAGSDAAGALERLGAGMKSFEHDRSLNPRVKTVYVVRALTPELQNRINQGDFFDHVFALSELLVDERRQRAFANLFLRVVLKKSK